MDYKIILGSIATGIILVSNLPYFWDMYKGRTKPHAFSWLAWGVVTAIGFIAGLVSGGGIGAWALGAASLINFITAGIGFWQKQVQFVIFDWICLVGSFLAIILWQLTGNALVAIILVTISDGVAFLPSFRKAYFYPHDETASTFALSTLAFILSIISLQSLTLTTALYPAFIAAIDAAFVTMILIRRKQQA